MKQLFLLLPLTFLPIPMQAQQQYQTCYREVEGYDGRIHIEQIPCGQSRRSYCDPSRTFLGAILGGGVAASMSRGDGYKWSVPLGAFIGGAGFGCN
jgi:hypothetical protein